MTAPADDAANHAEAEQLLERLSHLAPGPPVAGVQAVAEAAARRLLLGQDLAAIRFTAGFGGGRFTFVPDSPRAWELARVEDARVARALEAVRDAAYDGRALYTGPEDRMPPPSYVTGSELMMRFRDALRAEFPGVVIDVRPRKDDR